ncbi:MAG: putative porin [Flavobacteriales bacterium]
MLRNLLIFLIAFPIVTQGQNAQGSRPDRARPDTGSTDSIQKTVPPIPFPAPELDSFSFDHPYGRTPLEYPKRPGLGNLGLDSYSLVPGLKGAAGIGHRPGLPKNPYAFPQKNRPPAFDVRYPITRLEYSMGSEEEQFFAVTHTQNITPRWNIGLRYRKFGSPGSYRRQRSNFGKFTFSSNFRDPKGYYQAMVAYQGDRSRMQQNGGIQDPTAFKKNEENSRGAYRIRLDQASSRSRYDRILLQQALFPTGRIFSKEVGEGFKGGFFHRGSVRKLRFSYTGENPSASLYDRILLDSNKTRDRIRFERLDQRGGILFQKRKNGRLSGQFRAGYRLRLLRNRLMEHAEKLRDEEVYLKGVWNQGKNRFGGKAAYGIRGYGKGDRLLRAVIGRKMPLEGVADSLILSSTYKERSPAYLHRKYRSNHFRWENSFQKVGRLHFRLRWGGPEKKEGISISHTSIRDLIYFGRKAMPEQAEEASRIGRARVRQRFRMGKWGTELYGVWQKEWGNNVLRFPEFFLRGGIFFQTPLFDRALQARFGARATYYSKYKAYAYKPATRRFYLQEEERIGNYPFIDIYFHGKVKSILFFLELDHGNAGLMGYRYFGAPHYPLRDRMIRAGFKWNIYN